MIRRLAALLSALLCLAGFGLTANPAQAQAQAQNVVPHHGIYTGTDHAGRHVSFSFGNHTQLSHFTVGHLVIGGAHVSNGMWHETCHNGYCTKGQWTSDGTVAGFWRHGGSTSWTSWHASFNPPAPPYTGTYLGRDHAGNAIHLSYGNHRVTGFKIGSTVIGDASVQNRTFEVCHHQVCFKGHWQTDHYVVGSWRHVNSHAWTGWEAHAYAA